MLVIVVSQLINMVPYSNCCVPGLVLFIIKFARSEYVADVIPFFTILEIKLKKSLLLESTFFEYLSLSQYET